MPNSINVDPFVHSIPLELDWETSDSRLSNAVEEMLGIIKIKGNTNSIRRHLRALFILCVRMHRDYPQYYLAYPRNNSFDHQALNPNPLGLKIRSMKKVIDALRPDFLDHHKGYNWFSNKESRLSRLRPNDRFINFIDRHQLSSVHYRKELLRGGIILKDENKKIIDDYLDTENTHHMRDNLSAYNAFIEESNISVRDYGGSKIGLYEANRTYRIFNGDFSHGGRFYGGWWQQLKKKQRQDILINGKPIIELDYKANHLCFLYGLAGVSIPNIENGDLYNISHVIPRAIIKKIIMLSLNTRSPNGTWMATKNFIAARKSREKEMWDRHVPNKIAYDEIVFLIKEAHPVVEDYFYRLYGPKLMYLDSRVAEFVMMAMTGQGIECLSIHDSFIVPQDKEEELRTSMYDAYNFIDYPLAIPSIEKV